MAKEITRFAYGELGQVYYRRFDEINPEFKPRRGGGWQSPFKLDLSDPHEKREDKCVVTEKYMYSVFEQGGEHISIYDYYMQKRGITDFVVAVKEIAGKLGVSVPDSWNDANEGEWKKKQNELERLAQRMQTALKSKAGAGTLRYLTETRGYDEGFIKWARFGFCDSETAREVARLCPKGFNPGIGRTNTLSIPYNTGGHIAGFVFRNIEGQNPKYLDAFISDNDTKKYHLFGLTGLTLKGDAEQKREIVVVEGEIDALRVSYAGINNVCAVACKDLSAEAIEEAKRRGVERVKLLFDIGEGKAEEKLERAVGIINGAGLASFVCALPEDEGGKQDPDSFLKTHTKEELQTLLDGADSGNVYLFKKDNSEFVKKGEREELTDTEANIFIRNTMRFLCDSGRIEFFEKTKIRSMVKRATGKAITEQMIAEEEEKRKKEKDAERQKAETLVVLTKAKELFDGGKIEEAIDEMGRAPELRGISREAEYERADYIETTEERKSKYKESKNGVKTQYVFKTVQGEKEQFEIPRGALTFIGGATSHGKSRMLQNLAVQLATDGTEGAVLYFSFEESKMDVELEMLNLYADMRFFNREDNIPSNKNLRELRKYYNRGEDIFSSLEDREVFLKREKEFDTLLDSGRLRVFFKDWDCEALAGFIRYECAKREIKAVFIDYVQEVQISGKTTKKEALSEICKEFKHLSVETQLPIILAAQVNREMLSPIEMEVQNIADASEIEHSAHCIMLLWNSVMKPRQKSDYHIGDELSKEAKKLEGRNGFRIGEEGKIYAVLAKNRGGNRNADAVLDFNGNTGRISQMEENKEEDMPAALMETTKKKVMKGNPMHPNYKKEEEIPFEQS